MALVQIKSLHIGKIDIRMLLGLITLLRQWSGVDD
jgi:hypothetical protein